MKKIIVSGATGFLGSELIEELSKQDRNVFALVRSSSNKTKLNSLGVKWFDIEKYELKHIIEEVRPDCVIHTAVQYGRDLRDKDVFDCNLRFGLDLLDLAIQNNVQLFVNSDTFSGKNTTYGYLETYHLSKRNFIEWARILLKNSSTQFANMRIEHMYGINDRSDKFVPFIIRSLKGGVKELDMTEGVQERDFVYISDVVSAYITVIDKQTKLYAEYEVGTGNSTSIKNFVMLAKKIIGSNTNLNFGALSTRNGEYMKSLADTSELRKLGWTIETPLESGIKKIID